MAGVVLRDDQLDQPDLPARGRALPFASLGGVAGENAIDFAQRTEHAHGAAAELGVIDEQRHALALFDHHPLAAERKAQCA